MNLSDHVVIPKQVMAREAGSETVILDLRSGIYFGLDEVGAQIWQVMARGVPLQTVCDELLSRYDTTRSTLEADVLRLAEELEGAGLITAAPAPQAN